MLIEEIDLFNIGFGESIVIKCNSNDKKLMVDCGTKNVKNLTLYKDTITALYKNTKLDFLLTHFHEDHSNLFLKLLDDKSFNKNISNVYLPAMIYHTYKGVKYNSIINFAIYVFLFASKTSEQYKSFKNVFTIFDQLDKHKILQSNRLFFLKRGDMFPSGIAEKEVFYVLWPEIDLDRTSIKHFSKLTDLINQLLSMSTSDSKLNDIINRITDSFEYIYQYILSNGDYRSEIYANPSVAMKNINEQLNSLDSMRMEPTFNETYAKYLELINSTKTRTITNDAINALSIVFHDNMNNQDLIREGKHQLLMTGDVTKSVLKFLQGDVTASCSPSLCQTTIFPNYKYYFVKAPHHGTLSHYSPVIENIAINYIISGGNYPHYGKICEKYYNDDNKIKYCTDCSACDGYIKNAHKKCIKPLLKYQCKLLPAYSISKQNACLKTRAKMKLLYGPSSTQCIYDGIAVNQY